MATTIGSIVVDLLARTGSFETDMNRSAKLAEKRAKEIDAAISRAGVAIGAALGVAGVATVALVSHTLEAIAGFQDLSDKMGDSAEQIATLQTAANLSGTSFDTLAAASVKLTASLAKTDDESKAVGTALADIGLKFEDFKKLSPVAQLDALAIALNKFADGAGKTATAVAILGKSGAELLPFLKDLAEGGERQVKLTDEQIAAADELTKATARLRGEFTEFTQQQTSALVPILTEVQNLFADLAKNQAVVDSVMSVLSGTISAGITVFQTLAVIASDVGFVFVGVGREIAAITAQLDALVRMDFSGFTSISEAVKEDGKRARAELDAFQARVMAIGLPKPAPDLSANYDDSAARVPGKPVLRTTAPQTGGGSKKDNSAAQIAAEKLARELDQIENGAKALKNANDNREKILEAQRSASLISDAEYYDEKRKLMTEADQAEIKAIEDQIKRLQTEQSKLSGKDAEKNVHKIEDARAKLVKAQNDAATNLTVLNINAKKSTDDLASSMEEARRAAESLLATTERGFAIELSGMGLGTKSRDLASAINQIEQTYEQKRQDLERDNRNGKFTNRKDDYDRELALIDEFQKKSIDSYKRHYAMRADLEKSAALGASEAAANYFAETQNSYKMTEEAVTSAFKGMEDALVEFVKTGKLDFKSLVDSILSDIARIVIRQQITGPLAGMVSKALGSIGGGDSLDKLLNSNNAFGTGTGGPSGGGGFDWSSIASTIGGLFSGFKFAEGGNPPVDMASLVGERGPEMFVPRTAGTIIPNHVLRGEGGGRQGGDTYHYNFTVGDVATVSMLKQAIATSQRQSAAALARNRQYGGALA